MNEPVSAAVHIEGHTVRWAEVVRGGTGMEVRTLGERTFDFDVAHALSREGTSHLIHQVRVLIGEALPETTTADVRVVLHPLDVFSFFTPVAPGVSERDRMRDVVRQAALLSGARSADSLRITPRTLRADTLDEGEDLEWMHVLALPKSMQSRIEKVVSPIANEEPVRIVTYEGAAEIMSRSVGSDAQGPTSFSLAIGRYLTHTEYVLTREGDWYHGHATADARVENEAYFALGFLNRIQVQPESVERLFVYGSEQQEGQTALRDLFGMSPEPLSVSEVVDSAVDMKRRDDEVAFVPCLGSLLVSRNQ